MAIKKGQMELTIYLMSDYLVSWEVVYNCRGAADLHIACLDQVGLDVALDMVWFTDIS